MIIFFARGEAVHKSVPNYVRREGCVRSEVCPNEEEASHIYRKTLRMNRHDYWVSEPT